MAQMTMMTIKRLLSEETARAEKALGEPKNGLKGYETRGSFVAEVRKLALSHMES